MSDYKDADGNPTTLYKLVRADPDWAASIIGHLRAENERLREKNELLQLTNGDLCGRLSVQRELASRQKESLRQLWERNRELHDVLEHENTLLHDAAEEPSNG